MNTPTATEPQVRLVASPGTWIEHEAVRQLYFSARLPGMRQVTGLPSLQAGKGYPSGAAFVTEGVIHPALIGPDIGCGAALYQTDLALHPLPLDFWAGQPFDLEHPWDGDVTEVLAEAELPAGKFDESLGTLGDGSHFVELQAIDKVHDRVGAARLGLDGSRLLLLVHSGSLQLGQEAFENYVDQHGSDGLVAEDDEATAYLLQHDHAVRWAEANRALLARRFLSSLNAEGQCLLDAAHNRIACREEAGDTVWIHRRGAVAADGPLVIAGTRGTLSYVVQPRRPNGRHAWSLAAGAGRKWARTESRARMRERFQRAELEETGFGGRVVCADRDLLYEDAPGAYKNIETVIADLVAAGFLSVLATLRPVLTYKTRHAHRRW